MIEMKNRYLRSEELLQRALKTIPLGTQTFSKSRTQFPFGVSPYYITKGEGSRVWDIDGNEYIDFINGLASITLGYNDPDVLSAVRTQLNDGTIFSLPHPIEVEVAEKIVEMVPCAEMVRFGKNGSDATTGAIRLARAFTKRDHIAVCGYHGWHDWYIGSTSRNMGVPQITRELTHSFIYNDIESLQKIFQEWKNQVAAVIIEPMNNIEPEDAFLENVKELSCKSGALLIFDETITGFRFANGGAQEYFGVIPDLATFGKGMANGFPVSAVVGRADIMKVMEDVFFSFTFGGEAISLAAALATMTKLQKEPVIKTIWTQGHKITEGAKRLIEENGLGDVLSIAGKDCWSFLSFRDTDVYSQWEIKTLFLQEIFARGILFLGTHNMSYAHSDSDIAKLLKVYGEVFPIIKDVLSKNNMEKHLRAKSLVSLFKIR